MGAVVLSITGAEALYADMGHFGKRPIRVSWFVIVWPALVLNYLGQAALILDDPKAVDNPFYLLAPDWARWPLVVLATFATVIASQAVISGGRSRCPGRPCGWATCRTSPSGTRRRTRAARSTSRP